MSTSLSHRDRPTGKPLSSLVLSSVFLAAQPAILGVLSLFGTAFIIRVLGPAEFGRWATAAMLAGATGVFANMGMRPLFVRALAARPHDRRVLLAQQLGARMLVGCVAAALSVVAAVCLRYSPIVINCSIIFALALVLTTIWTVLSDYLQAFESFNAYAIVSFVAGLVLTVSSVAVVWFGGGAVALAWTYVAGPFITTVGLAAVVSRRGELAAPRFVWAEMIALTKESRSIAGAQILSSFRDRAEQLVLPKFVGEAAFGVFAGSIMPADRLNMFADALATVMYPRMSAAEAHVRRIYASQLVLWIALAASLAGAVLYTTASLLGGVLMPSHAQEAATLMKIMAVGVPAAGLAMAFNYALQADGRHQVAAHLTSIVSVVTIGITIGSVVLWGVLGAAVAWVARQFIMATTLGTVFASDPRGLMFPVRRTVVALGALAAAAVLVGTSEAAFVVVAGRAMLVATVFLAAIFALQLAPRVTGPWIKG